MQSPGNFRYCRRSSIPAAGRDWVGGRTMISQAIWMIILTLGLCLVILTAAAGEPTMHLLVTGLISVVFAMLAIRENLKLTGDGAPKSIVAASTARYIGLIWTWGAIGILAIYLLIEGGRWNEWWHYFLGFLCAAIGSILYSTMLERDTDAGREDASVIKLGRALVIAMVIGVVIGIGSMVVEGKFPRDAKYPDWAACNIFFFGGLSIVAICLNALTASRRSGAPKA